ncbi:hypothetical protein CYMTET_24664 [Cymbomonas tetramitiformis]|uniref:Cyclic nucleotide-binding domain-containing protein n=1 Tax=Cymbomonas tetramitiformis TaxID=36881 RepID=A0AAE0FVF5_9CHLO|nr:hypothetical protein CYMTET_24664 [Cymbomonas tetramitiformis]
MSRISQGVPSIKSTSTDERSAVLLRAHWSSHLKKLSRLSSIKMPSAKTFDKGSWTLNPTSDFMTLWDVLSCALLISVALITPYEVGFLSFGINWLRIFNAFLTAFFTIDIIFQFHLPFLDTSGVYVKDLKDIRVHYLHTWFGIDLLSVLPSEQIIRLFNTTTSLQHLRGLRLIRVFRLMKLLRVLRGMRLFNRWEARLSINYTIFELVMLVMGLMLFAHWMACIFGVLMASELIIDVDDDIDRWATAFGGWLPNVHRDSSAVDKYAAALYWSMSMVMGFGSAPLLFGADEVFLYILGMVLCGVMNAYLIGGVVSMLERIKEHTSEFHRTMDTLNSFLVDRRVMDDKCVVIDDKAFSGQDICEKLRSYYIFKFKQGKMAENWQEDILRTCSQFMQSAVAYKMHARTLGAVPLFRPPREQNSENLNKYQRFITYISMHLETQVFSGHEVVFYEYDTCDCLYIVEKGSVFVKGRVCRYGDYFGERVFDTATSGRGHRVITLTDSVLLTINQQVLHEAMDSAQYRLPELKARIASAVMQAVRVCSRAARYTVHNQVGRPPHMTRALFC